MRGVHVHFYTNKYPLTIVYLLVVLIILVAMIFLAVL